MTVCQFGNDLIHLQPYAYCLIEVTISRQRRLHISPFSCLDKLHASPKKE